MSEVPQQLLIWIIGVIFGAGIAYGAMQRMKKDLNGVGGRQRRFEKNLVLVMMVITEKREDRMFLAQFLKDP
jgi:hypothetical protein